MTNRSVRRFARRLPYAVVLALGPAFALVYLGCGDDDAATGDARVNVDPGGTWGAEVIVNVVGRGRVYTDVRGVDCPTGSCFAKLVFPSNTADGATGGIKLNATPTSGVKFLGWSFEPASIAAPGRGPSNCNPLSRAATVPTVSASELSITLPFGETDGTPPAGQEAACASFRKVPLAYRVTATFEADLPPFDAGFDGGADEILYEAPTPGATNGRDVGFTTSSTVYWRYSAGGTTHIAYGTSPTSSFVPQSALDVATATNMGLFRVHRAGVVYTDGNDIYAIRTGSPTSATRVGDQTANGTCRGLAIDTSSTVYCRTTTSIVRWQLVGGTYGAPFVLYGSGLPSGNDIAVESTQIYIDNGTGIASLSTAGNDGGAGTPTPIVTGRSSISNFRIGTFGFAWSELGSGVYTTTSKSGSPTVNESTTNAGNILTLDSEQSSTGWIAVGTNGIFLAPSGGTATGFRGGSFTGAAGNSSYVLWNVAADGRVHRASRFGP